MGSGYSTAEEELELTILDSYENNIDMCLGGISWPWGFS